MKIPLVIALCSFGTTSAFVARSVLPKTPGTTSLTAVGRRQFIEAGAVALLISAASASSPMPALALEDLSEPTPEEKEAAEKAAYEERLRRKAELQKQQSKPNDFSSGMKAELAKQKEMKSRSKEQRRDDLCEELGRGC